LLAAVDDDDDAWVVVVVGVCKLLMFVDVPHALDADDLGLCERFVEINVVADVVVGEEVSHVGNRRAHDALVPCHDLYLRKLN
jgi:hypothetical protein